MTTRLTRRQMTLLGLLVAGILGLGGIGLTALAAKERLWAETYDVTLVLADAGDIPPGTTVRIRGVDAGHVTRLDDADVACVKAILRLDPKYRGRLFNDATVKLQPVGMLGTKAVAISPGTSASGVLSQDLVAQPTVDLAAVAEKLSTLADETGQLIHETREGNGTLGKLVKDDGLYRELTSLAKDARAATGSVEREAAKVNALVTDGRDTLRSVRQSTDAVQRLPIIRGYVENASALLVRPDCRNERFNYNLVDLFEPGTAILHEQGREHMNNLADLLKRNYGTGKMELVVMALADPNDTKLPSTAAFELTRKQAEAATEALKAAKAHKTGTFSRNHPVTALGLGTGPSPVADDYPLPARLTVFAFSPP